MITKEQAMTENHFHFGTCTRTIGKRGKVTDRSENWRRNGVTQTWKTDPGRFRIPIKYGLRGYSEITNANEHQFHTAKDCPLNKPVVTKVKGGFEVYSPIDSLTGELKGEGNI